MAMLTKMISYHECAPYYGGRVMKGADPILFQRFCLDYIISVDQLKWGYILIVPSAKKWLSKS